MAIGRITGQMLFPNLERQGVDLQVDTDLVYFDVGNRRLGVKTVDPQYPLDVSGNVRLGNLSVLGNSIVSDTGKIDLGTTANVVLAGGTPFDVLYTDGNGNLAFGNLNELASSDYFTGNNIILGDSLYGPVGSDALPLLGTTTVTDAIAEISSLLGNLTNATGDTVTTGNLYLTAGVPSDNYTTGTLVITGGVGLTGNLNILGNINMPTGNVVINNTSFFIGNAVTGFDAIYAGIPSGFTTLPQVVAQFTADSNSYAQVNFQNINSGSLASTDFVATADNGTDDQYYVDLGINSSTFNNPTYGAYGPNDSYLIADGGNLLLNAEREGKTVKVLVGGYNVENLATQTFAPNTISSDPTSGTFVVYGDTGITGNVSIGGTIPLANITTANIDLLNANTISLAGSSTFTNLAGGNVTAGNVISEFYGNIHTDYIFSNVSPSITIVPAEGGIVAINSPTAIKVPAGTVAERPTGVEGYVRYNTEAGSLEFFDGIKWVSTSSILDSQMIETADGETTTFTLTYATTASAVLVSINGVIQQPNGSVPAYTVDGDQITFAQAPLATDLIDIRYISSSVTPELSNYIGNIGSPSGVTLAGTVYGSTTTTVGSVATVIDSFPATYHGAKYVILVKDNIHNEFQTAEVMLAHDGTTSSITTYAIVYTGSSTRMTFTTDIISGNVFLYGTGVSSSNTVKLSKNLL